MSKSWVEKRDCNKSLKIKTLHTNFAGMKKGIKMLVITPLILDNYIRKIPTGNFIPPHQIRGELATIYNADKTCPVSTGIFLRIIAEAAYEELTQGHHIQTITPFWRVIDKDSNISKKLSFGTEFLKSQQIKENI